MTEGEVAPRFQFKACSAYESFTLGGADNDQSHADEVRTPQAGASRGRVPALPLVFICRCSRLALRGHAGRLGMRLSWKLADGRDGVAPDRVGISAASDPCWRILRGDVRGQLASWPWPACPLSADNHYQSRIFGPPFAWLVLACPILRTVQNLFRHSCACHGNPAGLRLQAERTLEQQSGSSDVAIEMERLFRRVDPRLLDSCGERRNGGG